MPNIKSSILSVKTDAKRHAKNLAEKSRVRTASRNVLDAVEAGNTISFSLNNGSQLMLYAIC